MRVSSEMILCQRKSWLKVVCKTILLCWQGQCLNHLQKLFGFTPVGLRRKAGKQSTKRGYMLILHDAGCAANTTQRGRFGNRILQRPQRIHQPIGHGLPSAINASVCQFTHNTFTQASSLHDHLDKLGKTFIYQGLENGNLFRCHLTEGATYGFIFPTGDNHYIHPHLIQ